MGMLRGWEQLVTIYLLEYDIRAGMLVDIRAFPASMMRKAERARLLKEAEVGRTREVVLIEAESLDSLRKTHRRYFESPEEILAGFEKLLRENPTMPRSKRTNA